MTSESAALDSGGGYTVVVNRRIKAGQEAAFEEAMRGFIAYAVNCPGSIAMTVLRPVGDGRDYSVVSRFVDEAARAKFKATDAYVVWMKQLGELTEGAPQLVEQGVLEEWLRPASVTAPLVTPPRYKTALATFVGVYLLVITLNVTLGPLIAAWPFFLRHALFNACVVVLLAWVVMPLISRVLRPWLYPQAQ